ncbi:hypothetical protein TSMEX_011538 [Taenia solium]|eukprot:TsM_000475200 transcript=TsM_000475200 gene=TsM_000475200
MQSPAYLPPMDCKVVSRGSRDVDTRILLRYQITVVANVDKPQRKLTAAPWTQGINSIAWIEKDQKFTHVRGVEIVIPLHGVFETVILLKVFHPESYTLRSVSITPRPLTVLLMSSNLLRRQPAAIELEFSESESYNSTKLRAVIDFVSENIHVLQAIMESNTVHR